MAKKRSPFQAIAYESLKEEINSFVEYMQSLIIEELTDDIDWRVTAKGVYPSIVSKIEEKIKTLLGTIKDCSDMLLIIHDKENMSPYILDKISVLRGKLDEIREYYQKRPVAIIEHRRLVTSAKAPTKADPNKKRDISFLVATREQQINDRSRISKLVLQALPTLEKLEGLKEDILLRGGMELPEAMEYDD